MTPVLRGGKSGFAVRPEPPSHRPHREASGDDRALAADAGRPRGFSWGRRDLRASLLLGLLCLVVYNANRRAISAGDTYPARYLPFVLWHDHTLLLDPIAPVAAQGRGAAAFWMQRAAGGHLISLYPVVLPVLLAPLYLPAVAYLHHKGWTEARLDRLAKIMEKLSASLVASLSASLLYLLLLRRVPAPTAGLLTLAYAFGTTTWVIGSQALWQHGLAELLGVGLLLLLTAPCTVPRALAAGLLCGLLAANRPPDALLAAALGVCGLFWAGRRAAGWLAAAAVLPLGLVLLYNLGVAGHVAGGYGLRGNASFFQHDLLAGLGGLLVSPTRGLFVFSPFLLFLVPAWRHLPRAGGERRLGLAIAVGAVLQLVLYAKADWRAGMSWGPRYMTDLLPLLLWLSAPVAAALYGWRRTGFLLAVGVAIAIEAVGAFCYTDATDDAIFAVASGPEQMRAAWSWRHAPFLTSLRQGLAPAEWLNAAPRRVDAPQGTAAARPARPAGPEPSAPRPAAEAETPGDFDPETSFRMAAERLREHQQGPGYWLTAFTGAARFAAPGREMNTYTTALLVDLLDPLAESGGRAGLGDSLRRARRHLTAQIEAGGLVRYHGLPDGPGIGTLGCAITPDSDDTALVWRLAPDPDRSRLQAALATLERYRTREGLYRTWLAQREAYQCLDPGADPNPADLAIQMHLLLLFAEARPPAGRALCASLRPVLDQDRVWVYYRKTPLVPMLRRADLRRVGCALELPASRMRTEVAGQEIWVALVRLLDGAPTRRGRRSGAAEAQAQGILRQLAASDFALLRQTPPLLYHNDLTASVPRYYWSEDVGYALWLKLAHDYAHLRDLRSKG